MLVCDALSMVRTVSVVGFAKNSGKTFTLNRIIDELAVGGASLGVTSIGRDGEQRDVLDPRIMKPRIFVPTNCFVCTTDELLSASGLSHRIVTRNLFASPLGDGVVAKVLVGGFVEIAGPSKTSDVITVCSVFCNEGCDRILIDGALNRRITVAPHVSDGVVVATGATLGSTIKIAANEAQCRVHILSTKVINDQELRTRLSGRPNSVIVSNDGEIFDLGTPSLLTFSFSSQNSPWTRGSKLFVAGAVTDELVHKTLMVGNSRHVEIIARNSSCFIVSSHVWLNARRNNLEFRVLQPTNVLAVTVNPVCPPFYAFDSNAFLETIREKLPEVPVYDVNSHDYRQETSRRLSSAVYHEVPVAPIPLLSHC